MTFMVGPTKKCLKLSHDLAMLTSSIIADGVAVSLLQTHYEQYRAEDGYKARKDSKYGLCFRIGLLHFMTETLKRKYRGDIRPLHVVLESGHPNYGDAERIFFDVKKEFDDLGAKFLGTITKADKDEPCELMIADFVAHTTFVMQSDAISGKRPLPPSDEIPRKTKSIAHFESTPEGLARIRAHAILLAQQRKATNRRVWEAGSSRNDV